MKFKLKRTALAVHRALPLLKGNVPPAVQPPQKDEAKAMKTKDATPKVFLKKNELNDIADHMFASLQAEGKVPPYNRRGVNLEGFFWRAAKNVLPATRVPHSFSEYIRAKLVSKLNYRLKKHSAKPIVVEAAPAPMPAPQPPKPKVVKAPKAQKDLIVVERDGVKATFSTARQAASYTRILTKNKSTTKPKGATTKLSTFIKEALKVNGAMSLHELIETANRHQLLDPSKAAHKVVGMAMVAMTRLGDVKKLDNGSWTL